jgi:formaldehyde-activating enzyme involved in methanogenesis
MNLYSKLVPAGRLIVVDQRGLDAMYLSADSAGAEPVLQLPNCDMDPTTLIVWPTEVTVFELKVTATVETAAPQLVAEAVALAVLGVVDVEALLDAEGFGTSPAGPAILISAQVR